MWRPGALSLALSINRESFSEWGYPEGAAIYLDDDLIPEAEFEVVGISGLAVYRTKIEDGVHSAWSIQKFGILVYGYDNDVSYGYPGGVGLADLTED